MFQYKIEKISNLKVSCVFNVTWIRMVCYFFCFSKILNCLYYTRVIITTLTCNYIFVQMFLVLMSYLFAPHLIARLWSFITQRECAYYNLFAYSVLGLQSVNRHIKDRLENKLYILTHLLLAQLLILYVFG